MTHSHTEAKNNFL